jgi:hypothetical protein
LASKPTLKPARHRHTKPGSPPYITHRDTLSTGFGETKIHPALAEDHGDWLRAFARSRGSHAHRAGVRRREHPRIRRQTREFGGAGHLRGQAVRHERTMQRVDASLPVDRRAVPTAWSRQRRPLHDGNRLPVRRQHPSGSPIVHHAKRRRFLRELLRATARRRRGNHVRTERLPRRIRVSAIEPSEPVGRSGRHLRP